MAEAENALKKVRKLESNKTCPNCGTPAPTGLGFGNICMKFLTFVCDNCKSSHQAISHRCKSVAMSSWTMEEVMSLTSQQGGGNDVALRTWLALAPPVGQRYPGGKRPEKGDKIDIFKQFIIDCYEKRMFYGDSGVSAAPTAPERSASAPAQTPVQQTTDFFSFDDDSAKSAAPAINTHSFDQFGASAQNGGFDAFNSPSSAGGNLGSTGGGFDFSAFGADSPARTHSAPPLSDPFALNTLPVAPASGATTFPPTPPQQSSYSSVPTRVSMNDIDPFAKASPAPTVSSNAPIGASIYHSTPSSASMGGSTMSPSGIAAVSLNGSTISGSSGGFDVFGSEVLQPSSNTGLSGCPAPHTPMGGMYTSPVRSTGVGMVHNPNAAAAISSLGMGTPPQARQARTSSSSGAFDFVGGVMQSELGGGRGVASAPGGGMGAQAPQQGIGMMQQPRPQGMGMGMGGGMGGGMTSMNGPGSFNISGMGSMGGPPPQMGRGMGGAMANSGGASFPSDWGK